MCCRQCYGSGWRKEGTGHTARRYPFDETTSERPCDCSRGDAVRQEMKDAAARRSDEWDEMLDYIARKTEELREAETARLIASGLRYCPKCDAEKSREGFRGFDICGDCLAATVIEGKNK